MPAGSFHKKPFHDSAGDRISGMTEKTGHFEQGRWVEENHPPVPQAGGNGIDQRLNDAINSVFSSIDTVMSVARDLVTTKEGKEYIEKTLVETQTGIKKSLDAIIIQAKDEMDKKGKR
jgi:hypothetical protein